jgi:DNA-binding CsgD family transcriptional regulator
VRVTQQITLAGGYTITNWITLSAVQTTTLDALQNGRVISATADLTVQDLAIQNGRTTVAGSAGNGAGIHAGQPPLSPSIARKLLQVFQEPRQMAQDAEAQLTSREREVLTLIAKGYTVGRVAELLGITRNTAAGYVKSIYRKLNVSSRAEATLAATRHGLIGLDTQ